MVGFPFAVFLKDGRLFPRLHFHHIVLIDQGKNVGLPCCASIMIGKS